MSIKERKLYIIEEFLKINDEEVIRKFESLLRVLKKSQEDHTKPLAKYEFLAMIDQAEKDIQEGRITTQEDLLKKINQWD